MIKDMAYMKKDETIILTLILIAFTSSIFFYQQMPDQIAAHWNAKGEVDGYMSKLWGLFLMPMMLTGIAILFMLIPKIDPLKANIEKFRKEYNHFIIIIFIFMLLVHLHIILWNIGIEISTNLIIPIISGFLFYQVGILCEKAKKNWFIGIRTPWTLSNEKVWDKTNKLAGKLFRIAGVIVLTGTIFQKYMIYLLIIPVIFVALYTMIYSYVIYQKEEKIIRKHHVRA